MNIFPLCSLGAAIGLHFISSVAFAQDADDYRFEITTIPNGAAVFVGKTYKGVTPYQSDWVKEPAEVSYTLVKGGSKSETVTIPGIAGSTASVEVKLTSTPDLDLQQAGLLLEAIRAELAKTDLLTETQGGFPKIGAFLTDDFKTRLKRALRVNKAGFLAAESAPLPRAEGVVWEAYEMAKSSPTDRSVQTGIGWDDGSGYRVLMVFTNQGGVWLLSNCQDVGQDVGN